MKKLEDSGFIVRETRNIKGGRERLLKVNKDQFDT
jgi:predicted transcriptional regulator